jgi:hypothetical protein
MKIVSVLTFRGARQHAASVLTHLRSTLNVHSSVAKPPKQAFPLPGSGGSTVKNGRQQRRRR